jgi:recombination protein RecT
MRHLKLICAVKPDRPSIQAEKIIMNAPSNLPATTKEQPQIVKLSNQLDQRASEFKKALPSHITPEKLQRTIITAAQNNPDLLLADRQSLITSCMKAAQDGLLPDGREAALVIFSTSTKDAQGNWQKHKLAQYMPMAFGLRKKITQSGEISSLQTGLVYRAEMEAGAFIYEVGMEPPIRHRPMLDLSSEDMADDKIIAAYSMAKMKDGTISVEVMRRGEIDKVRENSQTGATRDKKGQPRTPKGPWVDWFGEMARKTVMRRHSKTLPMSGDIIIDVEGRDEESAASAAMVLSIQPDAPVALPTPDQLDEQHDAETGEILDARGMTVVDEDTARELDAREVRTDAEHGDQHDDIDELPAWHPHVEKIRGRIVGAKNARDLGNVETEFLNIAAGLPDEVIAEIEALLNARRNAKEG